jgi:hypothetical protein
MTLQICFVTWASYRGWYFNDDYAIRGQGAWYGWLDPEYLFQPWGGHLMPAAFAVAQVTSKLADFAYGWTAVGLALGQALVVILLYRLLMRHFGARWRMLVPLLLFLTSIPVLQATVWWASAINALPFLACMVIAADHTLRLAATGRKAEYIWIVALCVTALAFFEKAVLLAPFLAMLLVATTDSGSLLRSVRDVLRRHALLWAALIVMYAGWFVLYRANGTSDIAGSPNLGTLSDQVSTGLVGTFVPSLYGGPWDWSGAVNGYTLVSTSPQVGLVLTVLSLVIAAVLMSLGPRARRAVATVVLYAVAVLVLVNVGRSLFLVATSGLPRYYADLTLVTTIALALCLARLRNDPAPGMLTEPRLRATRSWVIAALVGAQVLVLSWSTSAVGLAAGIGGSSDIPWVERSLASLRAVEDSSPILVRAVPDKVLFPLLYPYNEYDWFFAGVSGLPDFDDHTDRLRLIDDEGVIVDGHVAGPASAAGPFENCGWRVQGRGVVRMEVDIIDFAHTMQIAYISAQDTTLSVRMGDAPAVSVPVQKGLHDVYLSFSGGGRFVTLETQDPSDIMCVGTVRIGVPDYGPLPAAAG